MDYTTSSVGDSRSSSFRENTRYKILTPSGFQPFDGVRRQYKPLYTITLSDGQHLFATTNHKILTEVGWRDIADCSVGTIVITKEQVKIPIVDIQAAQPDWVYDPINVGNGFAYNSGEFISHNCSFLSTSYTLIRSQVLQTLTHSQPIAETGTGYCEFVPPDPTRSYTMTVDTASGQGLDYSTFVIVDVTQMPYQVVATYANNRITTMEFPQIIMEYANRYHRPWLMVEVMDIGRDIAFILSRDHEYDRLMTAVTEKRLAQRLTFNAKMNRHLGLRMTSGVKRSGCAVLKTLVENRHLILNDYRIIQQLSVFVQKGSLYMAETGHHDDLVMPLVMLGWISLQPNFAEVTTTRALDVYTQLVSESKHNPVPIEPMDEKPTPIGFFGNIDDEDDPNWLLH